MNLLNLLIFISLHSLSYISGATIDQANTTALHHQSAPASTENDPNFNTSLGFILVASGAVVPALGALLLYVEDLIKLFPNVSPEFTITNNPTFLSSILSFSVGVLICSIFLALIPEGIESFETSKWLQALPSPKLKKIVGCCIFAAFVIGLIVKRIWFGGSGHSHSFDTDHQKLKGNEAYGVEVSDEITRTPDSEEDQNFRSMGNRIMIAFFIHNIPEGLVTFLSVYESYKTGIMFTIALSLHKLPEGIMISVPVYYGYKSKWKAVVACLICTLVPQLIGALLGWASTKIVYDSMVTGVMFLVATTILSETTFQEVIPMAQSYDPKDKYTTNWILIGIVLFLFLKNSVE